MAEEDRAKKNRSIWKVMMGRGVSSRHSMIETGSQRSLDRSSVSSVGSESQTSGSLDRLTASSHRHKPPKPSFFRLRPKTPTFWKPLFQPSGAGTSNHPNVSLPYRSQYVQTDITPTVEFGVQVTERTTSHTRDVPVQTCPTWDADSRSHLNIVAAQDGDTTTPSQKFDQANSNKFPLGEPNALSESNLATSVKTLALLSASIPQTAQIQEILPQAKPGLSEMAEIELDFNAMPLKYGTSSSSRFSSIRDFDDDNPLSKLTDHFEQLRNDFGLDLNIADLEKRSNLKINPNFEFLKADFSAPTSPTEKGKFKPSETSSDEIIPNSIQQNPSESITPEGTSSPNSGQIIEIEADQTHQNCSSPLVSEKIINSGCYTSEALNSLSSSTDILSNETMVFDSCENLEQLEDEIIRSLYTPIQESDYYTTVDEDTFNNCDYFVVNNNSVSRLSVISPPNVKTFDSALHQVSSTVEEERTEKIALEPQENETSNIGTKNIHKNVDNDIMITEVPTEIDFQHEESEKIIELLLQDHKKVFVNVFDVRKSSSFGIEPQIPSPVLEVEEPNTTPDTSGKCSPADIITTRPNPGTSHKNDFNSVDDDPPKAIISEAHIVLKPLPPPEPELVSSKPLTHSEPNSDEPGKNHSVTPSPPPPPPLPPNPNPISTHSPDRFISSNRLVSRSPTPNNDEIQNAKSPMVLELEQKFQNRRKIASDLEEVTKKIAKNILTNGIAMPVETKSTWIPGKDAHIERKISADRPRNVAENKNRNVNGVRNGHCEPVSAMPFFHHSPSQQHPVVNGGIELSFTRQPVITSSPPPKGAIFVDEKVTVDGDKIHTDMYYAIPVKEVLKEKKSTTRFIPAPEKYEGIGPTEEGIPVSLRQSVKKENMSDWYKTMYNTLHKIDNKDDTYVIGYSSDPEIRKEEKYPPPPKHELLSSNSPRSEKSVSPVPQVFVHKYPMKSTIDVYSAHPRPIEDFEPGYSSITDNETNLGSKRYFPTNKHPKTSYEFRNGYESESSIFKKCNQPEELESQEQKTLYREIQHGGQIPQFGLRKPPPEKFNDPVVGPLPPPPNSFEPYQYPQATRPETLPSEYLNNNENDLGQANGIYANQLRHEIHTELQQKGFQASPLSPNSIAAKKPIVKPPRKKMLARTLYDFTAETSKEISLKKNEIVVIHRELDKNWYEGEHKGLIGIFPVSYVEVIPPEHASSPPKKIQEGIAKVLYDFFAHNSVELGAKKGDEIRLIRKIDDNWYDGKIGSKKGIIPCSYISVIQEPGFDSNKNQQSSLSPSSKEIRSVLSATPTSDTSSSPYSKTNGSISSHNGHSNRIKKGNKLIEPALYRALYRYSPQNADELQLIEGDDVYVIEICDDGWFVGTSVRTGELGIIPGNYMEKVA